MNSEQAEIILTVRKLLELLVERRYDDIEDWEKGRNFPAEEIEYAISEYGATIISPPDSFYEELIDVIPIENSRPQEWSVVFPLWTAEEGKSDLSVEATFIAKDDRIASGDKLMDIEFDNIHVR